MATISQSIRVVAPVARATRRAAWAASLAGATAFACFFAISMLAVGAYGVATGHMYFVEFLTVPLYALFGGAFWLLVSLAFSVAITIPVSVIMAMCTSPLVRTIQSAGPATSGVLGFLIGAIVWASV